MADKEQIKKAKCLLIFQALDVDNSGTISHEELASIVDADNLLKLIKELDPKNTGEITFADFYEGFTSSFGDDDDDENDENDENNENDSYKVLGADINMDVVKSKHEEREKGFQKSLGAQEEEEEVNDDQTVVRNSRFKKILSWMKTENQKVGKKEICTTIQYLLRDDASAGAKTVLKDIFVKNSFVTVNSSAVADALEHAKTLEEKKSSSDGEWDNEEFVTLFLQEFEKLILSGRGGGMKDTSMQDTIKALTQKNKHQEQKIKKLTNDLTRHKKYARELDDKVDLLQSRLGDGAKGKKTVEQLEKEHADALKSFEDMIEQLQRDKVSLESKVKGLQLEHQSDKALLKVKQRIETQKKAELKELREKMKGMLDTHAEQNKLELKKKVGKMTAIIARRKYIRELQIENEKIPQLSAENGRLKDAVLKLQEEAKEYQRIMDSYREKVQGGPIEVQRNDSVRVSLPLVLGDEEELEELRRRLQEEIVKSGKLREQLDDTLNLLEEEKQAREAAEIKVQSLTEEVKELSASVTAMTAKITQLETDLEAEKLARKKDAEEFEAEIADLKQQVEDLKKQLAEEMAARKALEEQLNALGDDSQTRIAEMNQEIARLKKRIKELESELDSERTKREALEQELEETKNELENEQKLRKQVEEELEKTMAELTDALAKIKELEDILAGMEKEVVTIIEAKVFVEAKVPEKVDLGLQLNPDQQSELSAYARCFNKKLKDESNLEDILPLNENTPELLFKLKDGILIAKFINQIVPDTIDERALNFEELDSELMIENLTLAIGSAKAIGIPIQDDQKLQEELLSPSDPDFLLEFLFQLIKAKYFAPVSVRTRPELLDVCENPTTGLSSLKLRELEPETLQALDPQDLLLRWVNWHRIAEADGPLEGLAKKWGDDLCDATAYSSILTRIAECIGRAAEMPDKSKTDGKRARHVIDKATLFNIDHFHLPNNITGGNSRLNMLFAACIFGHHTGIGDEDWAEPSPGTSKRDPTGSGMDNLTDEMREERAYRMWINSMGIPGCFISNLFLDVRDGLKGLKLIDAVKPGTVDWKRIEKKPRGKFKKVNNCNYIIKYCKKPLNLKVKGIGGTDLVEGNPKLIMAIMAQLMRYDTMLKLEAAFKKIGIKSGQKEEDVILSWANEKVASDVHHQNTVHKIRSFKDKHISNSLFFFNLLWCIQPKLIKWKMVNTEAKTTGDKTRNAGYVISVARKLGAEVYLLPHDIVEVKPKQIMLFIGSIMVATH